MLISFNKVFNIYCLLKTLLENFKIIFLFVHCLIRKKYTYSNNEFFKIYLFNNYQYFYQHLFYTFQHLLCGLLKT